MSAHIHVCYSPLVQRLQLPPSSGSVDTVWKGQLHFVSSSLPRIIYTGKVSFAVAGCPLLVSAQPVSAPPGEHTAFLAALGVVQSDSLVNKVFPL